MNLWWRWSDIWEATVGLIAWWHSLVCIPLVQFCKNALTVPLYTVADFAIIEVTALSSWSSCSEDARPMKSINCSIFCLLSCSSECTWY